MPEAPELTKKLVNKHVLDAEYAVRGLIPTRAAKVADELKDVEEAKKYPFASVVFSNIGNPMLFDLPYSRFIRAFMSLVFSYNVLEKPTKAICALFDCSEETVERARLFIGENARGSGPYTNSKGFLSVRREVAHFVAARDAAEEAPAVARHLAAHPGGRRPDYSVDPENVYLADGASKGIQAVMTLLAGPDPLEAAFMLPIPQYPLYSATVATLGAKVAPYYLKEADNWSVNIDLIEQMIREDRAAKCSIKALVVINPSNPTGAVETYDNLLRLMDIAHEYRVPLLMDEVYQTNVYKCVTGRDKATGAYTYGEPSTFYSAHKVLRDWECLHGLQGKGPVVFSFHSVSKGFLGECGVRGGYTEVANLAEDVQAELTKLVSISLCSNTAGQLTMSCIVNPPADPEYHEHVRSVRASMERKAVMTFEQLNAVPCMCCRRVAGSMYTFPRIYLPKLFIDLALERRMTPCTLYCLLMLERSGICTVPGSGFGQAEGTYHFRMTILEAEPKYPDMLRRLGEYHRAIWTEYGRPGEMEAMEKTVERDPCLA